MMVKKILKVIPLGGLGEIGLNMLLVEYGQHIIIIDSGLMFPEDYMPGIDLVIPDFSYLRENRDKLMAVILTHGHEDHIGALPFLLKEFPVPVYGTAFTLDLLKEKLSEHNLPLLPDLITISAGKVSKFGPFEIEYIKVNHSIVDCVGLAIKTPQGILIHSGDFRIDLTPVDKQFTDLIRFAHYGKKGVLAFFSDSTNAEKEGFSLSEKDVKKTLDDLFQTATGRVIVVSFASNITRIQEVIDLSIKYDRKIALIGKSMVTNVGLAKNRGFINFPENFEIGAKQINQATDGRITIITTGSQGEPMSALTRMASGVHKQIKITLNDMVILSSKFIPGNEKAITSIINKLYKMGAEVVYEKVSDIHTSGHARSEELKTMFSLVNPKYFIPIHGEYRHLVKHAKLAKSMGLNKENVFILENGDVLTFNKGKSKLLDKINVGRVLIDGKGFGDIDEDFLRERRKLGKHGVVIVSVIFDHTGNIYFGPEIKARGFIYDESTDSILEDAKGIVKDILTEMEKESIITKENLESKIHKLLKRFFYNSIEKNPLIISNIIQMDNPDQKVNAGFNEK